MDPLVTSSLISAGSSLLGGLFGGSTNNHAGRDQRQATSYAIRASILDKVAAAKEAGISPLYALGAPVFSSTSAVGSPGGTNWGQTFSDMGHDVSRAVAAQQTGPERLLQKLTLEKAGLENDYLRAQIGSINARTTAQTGPALPVVAGRNDLPVSDVFGGIDTPDMNYSQRVQNAYGDIPENILGMGKLIEDAGRSFYKWAADPSYWRRFNRKAAPYRKGLYGY